MKRVLLTLVLCVLVLALALKLPDWTGDSATESAATRFMERYTTASQIGQLIDMTTADFQSGGVGDARGKMMRVTQRHLGKFLSIERSLANRKRNISGTRLAEVQFLGRFEKARAIVKINFMEMGDQWLVTDLDVEIPPSAMRRPPEEFAEMISLTCVRRISRADFDSAAKMGTEAFQLKFPPELISEAMIPLLAERGELEGLGVVRSKPAGLNRREVRVVALYKDGLPLGFDLMLFWHGSRWRVDELSAEETLDATIPPENLKGPVRVPSPPRKRR